MKKLLSVLLCAFLLFVAVGCTPTQEEQQPQLTYEEQKALYGDIISKYTALLTAKHNGEELPSPNTDGMEEQEAAIAEALYNIVNALKNAQTAENMGYGFKDIDGNGTPELLLLTRYTMIRAIFTISDNVPILLEANDGYDSQCYFATRNRLFIRRNEVAGHVAETVFSTSRVVGDKMIHDSVYGEVYDQNKKESVEMFQIVDGNRTVIDKETFNDLYREYGQSLLPGYHISKLLSPRIHLPLVDVVINENLPIADFSSYAAILDTYKKISTCLESFNLEEWRTGKYDNLFSFPNELSFEYYNYLLYVAYNYAYAVGYAEIDINGDGQDELLLMNDDYRIKAIFTQKNGTPVLLDSFSLETCWLDDQGFIHVDNENDRELEYSLYEFTKSGEYNLIYSILVADNGNRYLTKDGKTERITFEKSLELYNDDYCRYSEPFEPNEQTRNVSGLTITLLTEPTEDLIKAAADKIWNKYASLEKTTGKMLARSNTYVTFENLNDTQADVIFKYQFVFSYPDPNKDNTLLNDITESELKITARKENGKLIFDENGVTGKIEFGKNHMWIIIEKSSDERFAVGNHCYSVYNPDDYIQ